MMPNRKVNGMDTWQVNAPFSLRDRKQAIYNMLKDLETQLEKNPNLEYGVVVLSYNKSPPVPNEQSAHGDSK